MTTILVIEDMPSLREEILQMLELMGFQGIGAASGSIGIQLAHQHCPDLIICDIMMPEPDGYQVLQALRQSPDTAATPFIFLTAKADRDDMRYGMNLGADDYLTKPFTSDELNAAIAARLHKKTMVTMPYVMEMKRATEQLTQLSYQDPLTGLPNRIRFQQVLQNALWQAKHNQQSLGMLCIGLSPLRQITTTLGATIGESLLQTIADRLMQWVSTENPKSIAARLSGDEFSLLLTEITGRESLLQIAEAIQQALQMPYSVQGELITLTVNVGATLYPDDDNPAGLLLNHAIIAMDWGRKQGDSACQFYGSEIESAVNEKRLLETSLRTSLQNSELRVYYQPQVNLITGRIIGAEALLRWKHPELGWIAPTTFIPMAEELHLMRELGEWLLRAVCQQVESWQPTQILPIRVSINLSPYQLRQPELVQQMAGILAQTPISLNWIGIELSESAVMQDVQTSITVLQHLKEMGIYISIDDFGTGYSSLNYLKRLPIDALKIDLSLIKNVTTDEADRAIVSAIIALAQSLNLRVIAEGVETSEQLQFLRRQGCYAMQGYLFSPAVPATRFEELLVREGSGLP